MGAESTLRFDGRVVIVTGAGGGLGRAYAIFFSSLGANVVINDLSKENAQKVAAEIKDAGHPPAIVNNVSATEGTKIVEQAMNQWGRVDVLINNAGVLRDKSFKSMSDNEWDLVHEVHIKGAFSCSKAVWPIFRKQKYGRILNLTSAAGLYGNFGQANYSSCKMGLTTFAKTLAIEGAKYNILVNAIAPIAASPMTATVMTPDMLEKLKPEKIAPLVAYLSHETCQTSGTITEAGAGWFGKIRWERTRGAIFKADESLTPWTLQKRWSEVVDFENPDHPALPGDTDTLGLLKKATSAPKNDPGTTHNFNGQVVIITGAGGGLGRAYSLMFARYGARMVVNDVSSANANKVVEEIQLAGGEAVANTSSVENAEEIVKVALDTFGALHAIVNNAGILRDRSFTAMTPEEWDAVQKVHFRGAYKLTKAAWPIFLKQRYGRIINTTSPVGLYGNFGQANYSTYKGALIGFTKTLALEGQKYNILANVLAPNAGTAMTATVWPEDMIKAFKPDFVAPIVVYLSSSANTDVTKSIFEASGGWFASVRWQRAHGYAFPIDKDISVDDIAQHWKDITRFDERAKHPNTPAEAQEQMFANFENTSAGQFDDYSDSQDSELVANAKKEHTCDMEYEYSERDVILYNIGIGANEKELQYVYENDENFGPISSFGVIPQFKGALSELNFDWLPNYDFTKLLHGEQYLKIYQTPIPSSGTLRNLSQFAEVLDKQKAAAVTVITKTIDTETNELVFENHMTTFARGSGGIGGRTVSKGRGNSTALNNAPERKPDRIVEAKIEEKLAAIYRLSGDYNPLHIDPSVAKVGGFDRPILHGLCTFGLATKAIEDHYGRVKDIKTRFSGVAYPGETLVVSTWKEGNKIIFKAHIKGTSREVLLNAAATLSS